MKNGIEIILMILKNLDADRLDATAFRKEKLRIYQGLRSVTFKIRAARYRRKNTAASEDVTILKALKIRGVEVGRVAGVSQSAFSKAKTTGFFSEKMRTAIGVCIHRALKTTKLTPADLNRVLSIRDRSLK